MNSRFICSLFATILLISGCEKLFNKPKEVSSVDIADAYFLGVDRSNDFDSDPTAELTNNLIKVTSSELNTDPVSVDFLDESGEPLGNPFTYVYAEQIVLLSERYSVIWGEFMFTLKGEDTHSNGLLIDNQSGALYDLEYHYMSSCCNTYLGSKYHQQDKSGNIYFFTEGIKRILIEDPEDIQVEHYMDYWDIHYEELYFVDLNGNVFFDRGSKLKLATGGIIETGSTQMLCFNGFNENVFGLDEDPEGLKIVALTMNDQTIEKDIVFISEFRLNVSDIRNYYPDSLHKKHFFCANYIPAFYSRTNISRSLGFCFDESEDRMLFVQLPVEMSDSYKFLGLENNYLWLQESLDDHKLYSLDLNNYQMDVQSGNLVLNEANEFSIPEEFEITSLVFMAQRIVGFSAYDFLNEQNIRGFISMKNGLEYFEQESALGSVSLTRIR